MAGPFESGSESPPPPNPEGRSMGGGGSDFNRLTGAGMPIGGQMQPASAGQGAPSHAGTRHLGVSRASSSMEGLAGQYSLM
jgi:hypothetical protein